MHSIFCISLAHFIPVHLKMNMAIVIMCGVVKMKRRTEPPSRKAKKGAQNPVGNPVGILNYAYVFDSTVQPIRVL